LTTAGCSKAGGEQVEKRYFELPPQQVVEAWIPSLFKETVPKDVIDELSAIGPRTIKNLLSPKEPSKPPPGKKFVVKRKETVILLSIDSKKYYRIRPERTNATCAAATVNGF